MADSTEIEALKASFQGALAAADALAAVRDRVEKLDPQADVAAVDLEDLARVAAAHATAASALHGLVETMNRRRGT